MKLTPLFVVGCAGGGVTDHVEFTPKQAKETERFLFQPEGLPEG